MGIAKVTLNGTTLMDVTGDTVTAEKLAQNYTAHDNKGDLITGAMSGGGGEVTVDKSKGVIFIDYDGTYVDYWNPEDVASKTALPSNPSHDGLTAQGWNWTLSRIQAQILAYPDAPVWVGQMYITSSGATEIHISLDNPDLLSPYLKIAVNGTVTVDWGDGTSTDTVTGTSDATSIFTPHTYATTGDYVISISVTNGKFVFNNQFILTDTNKQSVQAYRYSSYIDAVYIGSGMTSIEQSSFQGCYSLQSITIPSSVTSINSYAFENCHSLQSITIPSGVASIVGYTFYNCYSLQSIAISGVTSFGTYAFQSCFNLQSITIPSGVTSFGLHAFDNCPSLQSITIPSSVTSIGNYAFQGCQAFQSITIPSSVTFIGTYAFQNCRSLQSITIPSSVTSIGNYAFQGCYALQSITIPSSVTTIGINTFQNCYALQSVTISSSVTSIKANAFSSCSAIYEYHLLPTTPPSLANKNAFSGIASDCVIYVPSASLEAYKTATNWSNYASKMVGE